MLEPATAVCPSRVGCGPAHGTVAGCCGTAPCSAGVCGGRNFLHEVQDLCRAHGALMILDEMITRFRWHVGDAQELLGIQPDVRVGGPACKPVLSITGRDGLPSMPLRTLFMQEMMRHGVIMPQVTIAFRHGDAELEHARRALDVALPVVAEGLRSGIEPLLLGPAVKPVFRRFN